MNEAARRTANGSLNEPAKTTASLLTAEEEANRETSSQEGGLRRPSEKETNREPSSEENGVRSQPKKDGEQGVRRAACGTTKQRGDGGQENGCNMGAACSNRRETGEFHSPY